MKKKSPGILFLCLCFLTGCTVQMKSSAEWSAPSTDATAWTDTHLRPTYHPVDLDLPIRTQIEQAMILQGRDNVVWYEEDPVCGLRDYGVYNGYRIVFCPVDKTLPYYLIIGDSVFYYPDAFSLLGYQQGHLFPVADLFEAGELTQEHLFEMEKLHNAIEDYDENERIMAEINRTFLSTKYWFENDIRWGIRNYGRYRGRTVLFVPINKGQTQRTIGQTTMESQVSFTINIYYMGFILHDWEGGVYQNWFTEEEISEIMQIHAVHEAILAREGIGGIA